MMIWSKMMFHSPSSYLMEVSYFMNDYLMMFISSVMIMILIMIIKLMTQKFFNSSFMENNEMELIWTILPSIILVFISIPSLNTLYLMDSCSFCGMSVKATGHQWYWSYLYEDLNQMTFDSYMKINSNLRLVELDNSLVFPCNIPIRMMVTSTDVIHSWTIPSIGVKMDAIPGRINQLCFSLKKSGKFFGQCSEICGQNHSFMPISLESIDLIEFEKIFSYI